jgi:hypothetical protein
MPTLEQLQQTIADWNEQYPVGTPVSLQNGFGVHTRTSTSSQAMLFAKTDAVIFLAGVINPVNLDRLTVD